MRAGESLLCRCVQQDGVALPLRQQHPFRQTADGHDADDCRAMGIDAFRFKRHAACSFGDAPDEQNEAALYPIDYIEYGSDKSKIAKRY